MNNRFELFVARRYLSAKRKQAVISVITVISIIGVAAGVMALVVALAINNGFRNTLQRSLLGATAHVEILEKEPGYGIEDWRELVPKMRRIRHVVGVSPTLYAGVAVSSPTGQLEPAVLKGILPQSELETSDMLRNLKAGSLDSLRQEGAFPGIILGSKLAQKAGLLVDTVINVLSPQGEMTPFGPRPKYQRFRVVGIFESGFFEIDSAWAFTSLPAAQRLLSVEDVVNAIELKLDDVYRASEVAAVMDKTFGPRLTATTWMEQNRQIFNALKMERSVTWVTIGLILLVAALNIFITLIMMVMEKYRDIAILMSMGARKEQVQRIFMAQGVLIGVVGSIIGLAVGYLLCYFAGTYHWIHLDEEVYALSFVPFEPRWIDGLWISAGAVLISFVATLYPARNASRIAPAEALRYE